MTLRWSFTLAWVSILAVMLFGGGCGGGTDLTNTLAVQRSGVLGHFLKANKEMNLLVDRQTDFLWLQSPGPIPEQSKKIGRINQGTLLVTNRVVRIDTLSAFFFIFPAYMSHDHMFAMVLDGPYAGKEISLGSGIVSIENVRGDGLDEVPSPTAALPTTGPSTHCTER